MHFRKFFNNKYMGSWDLPRNRDGYAEIVDVQAGELTSQRGTDKKPLLTLRLANGEVLDKPFVCNKTNAKAIAGMYGNDVSQWKDKPIALYVTEVSAGGETVEAIRVRPTPPKKPTKKQQVADEGREPGAEG